MGRLARPYWKYVFPLPYVIIGVTMIVLGYVFFPTLEDEDGVDQNVYVRQTLTFPGFVLTCVRRGPDPFHAHYTAWQPVPTCAARPSESCQAFVFARVLVPTDTWVWCRYGSRPECIPRGAWRT